MKFFNVLFFLMFICTVVYAGGPYPPNQLGADSIPTTTKITSGTIAAGASSLVVPLASTLINGSAPKFQLVFDGMTHVYLNDPANVGVGHGFSSVTSNGTNLTINFNYTTVSGGNYILYTLSDTY